MLEVTIFKDIKETEQPFHRDVSVMLKRIQDGTSKELVKGIRSENDKTKRNILKQSLPAICFSGTFTKRMDSALTKHSGLICLDFDGYKSTKDMLQEKERLSKDKYVYSVFISPSGNGLKLWLKYLKTQTITRTILILYKPTSIVPTLTPPRRIYLGYAMSLTIL